MKNSSDLGECYPPRPSAPVDNTLLYLQNSSNPTQPHSIIANYLYNNQINVRALIGQSAVGYCAGKPTEKSRVF